MPRSAASTRDCAPYRRRITDLCARLRAHPYRQSELFLRQAELAGDELPRSLRSALHDFRLNGNRDGYLLLQGLPLSPKRGAETCLALIGCRLGDIVGYAQEKNGALFHDIVPQRSEENQQSAASSKAVLALHTERCFHPFLPSHVLLACMRPDPGRAALTEIASVRRMLTGIPARWLPVLRRPLFRTGIDYSFGNVTTQKANGPVMSVLYGSRSDPCLRYDLDLMDGLTVRARAALNAATRAAQRACIGVRLAAGDLLVIDNRRAAHGRTAFEARYDGRDRWLKRAYLIGDLTAAAADCRAGERVIRTQF